MPPRPYLVIFDAAARRDLANIFEYISGPAGPVVAERFTVKLYQHCAGLALTPERGTQRDEIRRGLRTIGYRRRATITFRVDRATKTVVILGVYYGGRNYRDDFADEP
jgi:plasmid stabilization system protein ParE